MRGNGTIDYQQLGLDKVVYACELFYNMAEAHMELLDRGVALKALVNAHQFRCLARHDVVDHAMIATSETVFSPQYHCILQVGRSGNYLSHQLKTFSGQSHKEGQHHLDRSRPLQVQSFLRRAPLSELQPEKLMGLPCSWRRLLRMYVIKFAML